MHCSLIPEQGTSVEVYHFAAFIHGLQRLHTQTSGHHIPLNKYNLNLHLAHFNALCMEHILILNWNHGGISGDVHFAGHLRSNRTNVVRDKRCIRNMQNGGARELGLGNAVI